MKHSEIYIKSRINRLETNPIENANIIRKWKRMLRKIKKD